MQPTLGRQTKPADSTIPPMLGGDPRDFQLRHGREDTGLGADLSREIETRVERLLTAAQVAQVLGIRPKAVYELDIPRVELSPRRYRWRLSDLNAWIEARRRA